MTGRGGQGGEKGQPKAFLSVGYTEENLNLLL